MGSRSIRLWVLVSTQVQADVLGATCLLILTVPVTGAILLYKIRARAQVKRCPSRRLAELYINVFYCTGTPATHCTQNAGLEYHYYADYKEVQN